MENKVQFKAYTYIINQTKPEVRRFGIEKGVVASFCYLEAKLQEVFPSLKHRCFSVTWKDEDGDDITISSDDEMIIALSSMTNNVMKLNINCNEDEPQEINIDVEVTASTETATGDKNAAHCGVVCDVCDVPVVGFRYKCAICPNYDLCSKCETDGHHSEHIMVRFPMPKMSRSLVKAAIKRSRHVMKSMSNAAADVKELYDKAKYERRCEKKRHHGRGEHSRRSAPSWFDIFNSYINEFADLAGNGVLDTNTDKSPKPAESGSQQEPQSSENAASSTSKQDAEAADSGLPFTLNLDTDKVKNFLRVLYEIGDVDSEGKKAEQSNVAAEGGAGTSNQTSEAVEAAKAEISSTTKDVNEPTTSKDVSPERATDEWTVINKEKDLMDMEPKPMDVEQKPMDVEQKPMDVEQKPSAPLQKNVPIGYTLPQEFQQHLRISKEQLYPPLHAASAVLDPNEPQMTPWEALTKRWETEVAKRRAQNNFDYDFDPTQTEPQCQPQSFRCNNQAMGGLEQTQPQSFMPNNQAKTALQQTLPWAFKTNNHAKAGPHQTQPHDFKSNKQPKAGQQQGFKPNKPNNDKPTAGPQQTQSAQSSHIKPHIAAAIQQMLAMGFNNEGGWLTQLLEGTGGNIAAVIELLTPVKPK